MTWNFTDSVFISQFGTYCTYKFIRVDQTETNTVIIANWKWKMERTGWSKRKMKLTVKAINEKNSALERRIFIRIIDFEFSYTLIPKSYHSIEFLAPIPSYTYSDSHTGTETDNGNDNYFYLRLPQVTPIPWLTPSFTYLQWCTIHLVYQRTDMRYMQSHSPAQQW